MRISDVKLLRYIELKSGYDDNGPAWVGYVTPSKSGKTLYFNGHAFGRGGKKGEHFDCETGEKYWVSGVKKNCKDRHWAGSGKIRIEAAAVGEYLKAIGRTSLDPSLHEVIHTIVPTDIRKFDRLANMRLSELQKSG
jgi:hypothetical protein